MKRTIGRIVIALAISVGVLAATGVAAGADPGWTRPATHVVQLDPGWT